MVFPWFSYGFHGFIPPVSSQKAPNRTLAELWPPHAGAAVRPSPGNFVGKTPQKVGEILRLNMWIFPFFNILGTKNIWGFPTKCLIELIGIKNWFIDIYIYIWDN